MKTFKEWCGTEWHSQDTLLHGYLKYALGEMEKQLHPKMVMDTAFSQADEAYDLGYTAGENASEGMTYDSNLVGVKKDEYNRLLKQDRKAKDAFDLGYKEGKDYFSRTVIVTLRRENKAARECAMTWLVDADAGIGAINELRSKLHISWNDVKKNQYK